MMVSSMGLDRRTWRSTHATGASLKNKLYRQPSQSIFIGTAKNTKGAERALMDEGGRSNTSPHRNRYRDDNRVYHTSHDRENSEVFHEAMTRLILM
ncbi:hypothetical protein [Rugamonas sp.]|uniref:hypothetical protein n=1 Tax=Rugamonas sp. TaxID=1926287 RepID=UPI0025FE238A|nr:hypothetical protein [Rugamonas sp.]